LPDAASQWLSERGANLQWGRRWSPAQDTCGGEPHDAVILACPAREAARLTADQHPAWSAQALALQQAAIATVYVRAPRGWTSGWPLPMLSLPSNDAHPAQFVFDRGRLLGDSQRDVLACVVSASTGTREDITSRVLSQLQSMCATPGDFTPLLTVVEKRATFACTPGLTRPTSAIGPGWWACGDYVQGPYPATLEGAVRSGREVIDQIAQARQREGLR
jgi:hypothetical protein